jgi:hypothetical protein
MLVVCGGAAYDKSDQLVFFNSTIVAIGLISSSELFPVQPLDRNLQ